MKILITGAAGFIGSHLADYMIDQGHTVFGIDNFLTGSRVNLNPKLKFKEIDIRDRAKLSNFFKSIKKIDLVFHLAAVARTLWTVNEPTLANDINVTGTLNVLETAKVNKVKKVIFASSNIVYAQNTPYRISKLTGEMYMRSYDKFYNLPTISLRFSNVYGSLRQSEKGPAINCLASLRKSKRENGYIWVTGDGRQSRDFTHVLDIVEACNRAAEKAVHGTEIDICTGTNTSILKIAKLFNCPIKFIEERPADIKHIFQNPKKARLLLGFTAKRKLKDYIGVYLK